MITLRNVRKRYGNGPLILDGVNFSIRRGSFHFLTGPSGSGKSTLLRLLTMSEPLTSGTINVFGDDLTAVSAVKKAAIRRSIGIVLQDNPLLNYLTAWDNVALPLHILGKTEDAYREDVTDLMVWVGLQERINAFPPELSGGERQRVGIARAVIGRPALLLADEPTGNVDPQIARRLLRLFIELNKLGTTVIIATHDHQLMRQFKAPRLELQNGLVRIV